MAARQGLNATLSYSRDGTTRAFRVRANGVSHAVKAIFQESQAQTTRAFYPHRLSAAQFSITVQLMGFLERKTLVDWLSVYADIVINSDVEVPQMTVSVPSRNFLRNGVIVSGMSFGDHVGSMLWEPILVFETTGEPWDPNHPAGSFVQDPNNNTGRNETRYFYPTGIQLSGNEAPPDGTYSYIVDPNLISDNVDGVPTTPSGLFTTGGGTF